MSPTTAVPPEVGEETGLDEFEAPGDMVAHLYRWHPQPSWVTHCGIPDTQDPHCCMHKAEGEFEADWNRDGCTLCGAPLCQECAAKEKECR
jgi:hypothetical protein